MLQNKYNKHDNLEVKRSDPNHRTRKQPKLGMPK